MSQSVVKFVKPNEYLLLYIINNMRDADVDEVLASSDLSVEQVVKESVKNSEYVSVVIIDDKPCMVFGVVNHGLLTQSGIPWALGTDDVLKYRRAFIKNSKKVLDEVMNHYRYLSNSVHADNIFSIRWLKWMGFTIDSAKPTGINGEKFHRFHLKR